MPLTKCPCGSGEFPHPLHDGHGIFMCYVCSKCERRKVASFRRDIFERYETDDVIEAEDAT